MSLETQVGITSQKNKWANTDPRTYRRWDQVPRRSKHTLLTDHTCREPSSMIMNAELSAVKVIGMKNVRKHMAQGKFVIRKIIVTAIERL
jgi:hypothetical protein